MLSLLLGVLNHYVMCLMKASLMKGFLECVHTEMVATVQSFKKALFNMLRLLLSSTSAGNIYVIPSTSCIRTSLALC